MKTKILYAEDEPFLAQIVSDNLKAKGYDVIIAPDGNRALELFKLKKSENLIMICR